MNPDTSTKPFHPLEIINPCLMPISLDQPVSDSKLGFALISNEELPLPTDVVIYRSAMVGKR